MRPWSYVANNLAPHPPIPAPRNAETLARMARYDHIETEATRDWLPECQRQGCVAESVAFCEAVSAYEVPA